jgi:hypothetical protein
MHTFILTYRDWENGPNGASIFICNAVSRASAESMAGEEGFNPENLMETQEYPTDSECVVATVGLNDVDMGE